MQIFSFKKICYLHTRITHRGIIPNSRKYQFSCKIKILVKEQTFGEKVGKYKIILRERGGERKRERERERVREREKGRDRKRK